MKFLAFYLGNHDSNVAAAIDGTIHYAKSERVVGIKHHRADRSFVREMAQSWGIERPDAIAFSDGNRNDLGSCAIDELVQQIEPLWGGIPTFCLDHHYAHILSAWPICPSETVDVGIAIDGRGDNNIRARVIAQPGIHPVSLYATQKRTFGSLMSRIGSMMKMSGQIYDFAGKVMGLQAYGQIDHDYVAALDLMGVGEQILDLIFAIPWRGSIPAQTTGFFAAHNPSFRDWLATIHYVVECYLKRFFSQFCRPDQVIVLAGGCAQNTVYNEKLIRQFPKLVLPPHCYDGGLALGCLEFLRLHFQEPRFSSAGFPFWQNDPAPPPPAEHTIRHVAELLSAGKIVGWFQGRGEIGPRALGHRSILMSPQAIGAKDTLNHRVKHREPWRPYAPSILEPYTAQWFELDHPSQYMLRAVTVKSTQRVKIPAVVHEDYTSRVQTVPLSDEPFAQLLAEFNTITGVPLLLNTSLNQGGGPIFSRPEQALEFFHAVPLDAMCIGDQLTLKNA